VLPNLVCTIKALPRLARVFSVQFPWFQRLGAVCCRKSLYAVVISSWRFAVCAQGKLFLVWDPICILWYLIFQTLLSPWPFIRQLIVDFLKVSIDKVKNYCGQQIP